MNVTRADHDRIAAAAEDLGGGNWESEAPRPAEPVTGFRVGPDVLSDATALEAIQLAAQTVAEAALRERHWLMELGFADCHGTCRQLDRIGAECAAVAIAARKERGLL